MSRGILRPGASWAMASRLQRSGSHRPITQPVSLPPSLGGASWPWDTGGTVRGRQKASFSNFSGSLRQEWHDSERL